MDFAPAIGDPAAMRFRTLAASLTLLVACGGSEGPDTTALTAAPETTTHTGGETPTSGGEDTTDPAGLKVCSQLCTVAADCFRDGQQSDFICVDGVCVFDSADACTEDASCISHKNTASEPCTAQADCAEFEACVDVGDGKGSCISRSTSHDCTAYLELTVDYPPIEGGADVTVCIQNYRCSPDTHLCEPQCLSDLECLSTGPTPHCSPTARRCECASDDECEIANPGYRCIAGACGCGSDAHCPTPGTRCLADGACGCATDEFCKTTDPHATDTCYDGRCGCSSTAACMPFLDTTKAACSPP